MSDKPSTNASVKPAPAASALSVHYLLQFPWVNNPRSTVVQAPDGALTPRRGAYPVAGTFGGAGYALATQAKMEKPNGS